MKTDVQFRHKLQRTKTHIVFSIALFPKILLYVR